MLLSNRFQFFNKKGDNINPQKRQATVVTIIDDAQFPGIGAIINAYTDFTRQIVYIEILSGGSNYGPNTYIDIRSIDNSNLLYTIPNSEIIIGVDGDIQTINIPKSIYNNDFPHPSIDFFTDYSLERVSTGLIAVDQLYILENVFYSTGATGATGPIVVNEYTYPRIENYGPYSMNAYSANGTSARIQTQTFTFTGTVRTNALDKISRVSSVIITDLDVGMTVTGAGVPDGTFIYSVDTTLGIVALTNFLTDPGDITFTSYFPHDLKVGSKIYIDGGSLDGGPYTLTQVDTFNLYFDSTLTISSSSGVGISYKVVPQFTAFFEGDDSFFLFTVDYGVEYPVITKFPSFTFELAVAPVSDIIPSGTNVMYQRTISEYLTKSPLTLNIGHSADVEGNFISILRIIDNTFVGQEQLLFYGVYRAETESEDERLGLLLENTGRDVNMGEEMILRDSDINEDLIDNILLNEKRKEMLLQGEQIWPYLGSYRGLVNMINWFGYYDIHLKEYFLNVNSTDAEFGKYRMVPITFQLQDKKQNNESINLVPSKHYKKTSLFGLFYDIIRESGSFDTFGIPLTQDVFDYTNEEALIKFFALKKYLKNRFLPLNTQIVDITGEGVYYERYGLSSWNDKDQRRILNLSRRFNFTVEPRIPIQDLRPYSSQSYISPSLEQTLQGYLGKYNICDITIINPGGPYTAIPIVSFPGTSNQQSTGYVEVKGYTGTYNLSVPSGNDYIGGEIITLSGGTFDVPLRLVVTGVTGTAVSTVEIQSGSFQGSGYRSFPTTFGQALVVKANGSQYEVVSRTGFEVSSSDLGFQVEDVIFLTKGIGYSTYPQIIFTPNIGLVTADLDIETVGVIPVGNINNDLPVDPWDDSPNIPVGAVALLSTAFNISWDEVPYIWNEVDGSNDAEVKVYIDPLPTGSGKVIAAEIVSPGTAYTFVPTLSVVSQEGRGATLETSLRDSSLNILEFTVSGTGSYGGGTNNIFTVTPDITNLGVTSVKLNRVVKSSGITDNVWVSLGTTGVGSQIAVENIDGSPVTTTVTIGDKIYVHEGVWVTNGGADYTLIPRVNINGGHTRSIFTWNNFGRGEYYQMQWKIFLQQPVNPETQFSYDSGIFPIDDLIDHTVILPYTGKYTVEMIVFNTDNNFTNEIKRSIIQVYILEADFSYASKFINNSLGSWDSMYQVPITALGINAQKIENNRDMFYVWENANSRWVNLVFNKTVWSDANLRWDTLNVTDQSIVSNYNFPFSQTYGFLEVSPEDNSEGPIISYRDSTTTPSAINPTIIVQGQGIYPEIEAPYTPYEEWIFIRRDETVYQLDVLDADYSVPGYTYIKLVSTPPSSFIASPTTWEVLREIGGTVVVPGNQIYDEALNPNGFQVGKFVKIAQNNDVPIDQRITINGKNTYSGQPSNITLNGQGSNSSFQKRGEVGKIYKLRDNEPLNGNMIWDPLPAASSWVITPIGSVDPEIRDYVGKIYMRASVITADPVTELRPGFSTIKLYAYLDGTLRSTQEFRTTHVYLDTSTTGEGYGIWGEDTYVIDIKTIDGGPLDDLNNYLQDLSLQGLDDFYLEYEYNEFPTRLYYGEDSGGNAIVYFDFNTYPSSGQFNDAPATDFDATAITNHTNWFFDNGVASGDFSMKIIQVGSWQGGVGTIISLQDDDNDLMQIDSSFTISQRNFDEDSAERKLGTEVLTWQNYQDVIWQESGAISWNTVDFSTPYWCNFIINGLVQNSGLTFNEEDQFSFTGIVGGMSTAQIFSQALFELNNLTQGGLARFVYTPYSAQHVSLEPVVLNTYQYPDSVDTAGSFSPGDVLYGEPFAPATTVTGTGTGGTRVGLDQDIKKKASFAGNCITGGYKITSIMDLLENQVFPGDIITSVSLPSYPASPATISQVKAAQGKVTEITLSRPFLSDGTDLAFYAEWNFSRISTTRLAGGTGTSFKILAQAKNPSIDCLGYLTGDGGMDFETPDGSSLTVSHTFPTGYYYSWLGFGPNQVGGFLHGIEDLITNYRNIQTYLTEGLSPFGLQGWYPAQSLPPQYSFIGSSSYIKPDGVASPIYTFTNRLNAPGQSQRLPYERSIAGAFTWEETWMGNSNGKFPLGSSVLLTSDTSQIPGKTKYFWRIKENENILVETTDSDIMWNFTYPGIFSVELTIQDTNGNAAIKTRPTFIEVYETKKS